MKNKFIKSTFILLLGGFITKFLGMIIRIIMARKLGTVGMGTYMLIMPTFSLLIAISQFGMPVSISKSVSSNNYKNSDLFSSIIPIVLIINFILMLVCIFSSSFISKYLLHNTNTLLGLRFMGFVLPFISISSILRGYFFGKQRMFVHVFTNIVEDIVRLFLLFFIPIKYGISYSILYVILINIISEFSSILIMLKFIPIKFGTLDLFIIKDVMSTSVPLTISRIVGNIGYFFEPIIYTNVLNHSNAVSEYGIINGYVLSLLLLPTFFSNAISQSIIPVVKSSSCIKVGLFLSFIIGLFFSIIFWFFGDSLLFLIYHTYEGSNYLHTLVIPFILFYIEGPVISILQGMGHSNLCMRITLIGVIIKLLSIFILCNYFGAWGYIYSIIINVIFVTLSNLYILKKKTSSLL